MVVAGVCFVEDVVMQGILFEGQYVATVVPGVKAEHVECERNGFAWELQAGLFGGEQAICSRCQTVRPYNTERAS